MEPRRPWRTFSGTLLFRVGREKLTETARHKRVHRSSQSGFEPEPELNEPPRLGELLLLGRVEAQRLPLRVIEEIDSSICGVM